MTLANNLKIYKEFLLITNDLLTVSTYKTSITYQTYINFVGLVSSKLTANTSQVTRLLRTLCSSAQPDYSSCISLSALHCFQESSHVPQRWGWINDDIIFFET